MAPSITRWTAPCGCVFELESDPDSLVEAERNNKFLLANYICPKHEHLKSRARKAGHDDKSKRVMDILESIKQRNIDGSNNNIARHPPKSIHRQQAEATHKLVLDHNYRIHNEWSELTSNIHAHDEHVYDIVLKEHQTLEE
jgi:hypothetical protein